MNEHIKQIGAHFDVFGEFIGARPFGSGHINDTFMAEYDQGGTLIRYIHQRINTDIFKDPEGQMENIQRVTAHIRGKLQKAQQKHYTRETLILVPTLNGLSFHKDEGGNYWRTYVYVEGTHSIDTASTPEQAYQAAKAFGRFQHVLADLPSPRLVDVIPDFHNTPQRYRNLEQAIQDDLAGRVQQVTDEIAFARARQSFTGILLDACACGKIPERVVHNDTKLNNVLMDDASGQGVCVIDLDTVMPGLALYDFGDLVRTMVSPTEEDTCDLDAIHVRLDFFDALAKGYLEETASVLTDEEIHLLPASGILITLETGLRFLTDYLQGDPYFKTHREEHNLHRCRAQFRLVSELEHVQDQLADIVNSHINNFR